jgi:hypothetical protein
MSSKDKGVRTSREIMEAAIECVATISMENISLTEIVKTAGVNGSLVAYHFPNKDELFFQRMDYIINDITKKGTKGIHSILPLVKMWFLINHKSLITFINFLYYCGLKYRYFGQLKELLIYLKSMSPVSNQVFDVKVDHFFRKLKRISMDTKFKVTAPSDRT